MTDPLWPLLGAVGGAIIGSFIATLVIRWPQDRTVRHGRSTCDACGIQLNIVDLIPLIGFAVRGGRCRQCHAVINWRHPAIELAAALIGAAALAVAPGWPGVAGAAFGWMLLAAGAIDAEHFWLPDAITLPMAALGIVAGGIAPPPMTDRLIGLAAGYASLWLVAAGYRALRGREGLGGGDPKLFGAIGAWLGWYALPFVLLLASLAGLGAVVIAMARGQPVSATTRLPFGSLLAVAAFPIWLVLNGQL